MSAFTEEQQAVLREAFHHVWSRMGTLHDDLNEESLRLASAIATLGERGLLTTDEMERIAARMHWSDGAPCRRGRHPATGPVLGAQPLASGGVAPRLEAAAPSAIHPAQHHQLAHRRRPPRRAAPTNHRRVAGECMRGSGGAPSGAERGRASRWRPSYATYLLGLHAVSYDS